MADDVFESFRRKAHEATELFRSSEGLLSAFLGRYPDFLRAVEAAVAGSGAVVIRQNAGLSWVNSAGQPMQTQAPYVQINLLRNTLNVVPQVMMNASGLVCGVMFSANKPIPALQGNMVYFSPSGNGQFKWVIAQRIVQGSAVQMTYREFTPQDLNKTLEEALLP